MRYPFTLMSVVVFAAIGWAPAAAVEFQADVLPIFRKHCLGCHNPRDREGGLSLASMKDLRAGGDSEIDLLSEGEDAQHNLLAILSGDVEPKMPPEGEPELSAQQLTVIRQWLASGAPAAAPPSEGSATETSSPALDVPAFAPSLTAKPITDVAVAGSPSKLAIARFQAVDLLTSDQRLVRRLDGHPGKVNGLAFGPHGRQLFVATGITGLRGEAWQWDLQTGSRKRVFGGHLDTLYAVAIDSLGKRLATGGYDREIRIWDVNSGSVLQTLRGHNGPVYDLAFTPDGTVLASASADATVKVWNVETGARLDTMSQPLAEQYTVAISPDGLRVAAGGADNRIRVWQLLSRDRQEINPLLLARYAHEQSIERLRYTSDGKQLVTVASDRTMKVWGAETLTELRSLPLTSNSQALALGSDSAESEAIADYAYVGQLDGTLRRVELDAGVGELDEQPTSKDRWSFDDVSSSSLDVVEVTEQLEDNNRCSSAQQVEFPTRVTGTIYSNGDSNADVDMYRFRATAGQACIIEVRASRDGSPLDSHIKVLDARGEPVPRVLLKAVRDSYFTFRGKDSNTVGDFRLHNWEEMELNQLLYAAGEVVKLYHYPRGPDSGFNVYPNFGSRHGFFDTTPIAHALHEPCYIVEAHPPGTELPDNGLPSFNIYYENDDESQRLLGNDSKLHFVAPKNGEYVVAIEDVRRKQGEDFTYTLELRPPAPQFSLKIPSELKVPRGSGRQFLMSIERIDGFDGEVEITFDGVPTGYEIAQPLRIEEGHFRVWGTLINKVAPDAAANDDASSETGELSEIRVHATAKIHGKVVTKEAGSIRIVAEKEPKAFVTVVGADEAGVIEVKAGTTVTARIIVRRNGHEGPIGFGKEEALVNSPHGVFVDATGLNGVLIPPGENERDFFITAEHWVQSMERPVFVTASIGGNPTSLPVLLRVVGRDALDQ